MRNYSWPDPLSLECIQEFLATTAYDDQASIGMIGIFATERSFGEFGLNAPPTDLPIFNKSRILGNGRKRFIEMCRDASDFEFRAEGDANDWTRSMATALAFGNGIGR
jgi:hypothetical protein